MPAKMAASLKRLAVLIAAAAFAACAGSPATPAEPGGLAIVGAQLIDGTGEDPIPDSVIVIRDDRIVAAGPRATTGIPAGAEVVDAAGQTIIPGLVDMHAHYGADADTALEMMRTQLYYGVTTARSIGTDNPEQVALMLEAHAGRPDTPRLFTAGRGFTHPDGFNAGAQQPTSTDEAAFRQLQDFVKTMHDAGVRVALGTDSGTANVPMGWGTHHKLELYVEAGLTPMEAIVAATATSASVTPPVGEAEFGTLEVGKIADLVVLDADPLEDVRNTLSIDRVMKAGTWVEREGLLPVR